MRLHRSQRRRANLDQARALAAKGLLVPDRDRAVLDAAIGPEPLIPDPNRESRRAHIRSTWPRYARTRLAGFGSWRRHRYLERTSR